MGCIFVFRYTLLKNRIALFFQMLFFPRPERHNISARRPPSRHNRIESPALKGHHTLARWHHPSPIIPGSHRRTLPKAIKIVMQTLAITNNAK